MFVLLVFSSITITDETVKKEALEDSIDCVVHICSCHNMHSFKRFCERKNVSGELKMLIMGSCCRMMNCADYDLIKHIFRHMCVVMLSKGIL